MKDGLLMIDLVREIPESKKPKKIDIGSGTRGSEQIASPQTVDAESEHA
jgi:hypothetical protein